MDPNPMLPSPYENYPDTDFVADHWVPPYPPFHSEPSYLRLQAAFDAIPHTPGERLKIDIWIRLNRLNQMRLRQIEKHEKRVERFERRRERKAALEARMELRRRARAGRRLGRGARERVPEGEDHGEAEDPNPDSSETPSSTPRPSTGTEHSFRQTVRIAFNGGSPWLTWLRLMIRLTWERTKKYCALLWQWWDAEIAGFLNRVLRKKMFISWAAEDSERFPLFHQLFGCILHT